MPNKHLYTDWKTQMAWKEMFRWYRQHNDHMVYQVRRVICLAWCTRWKNCRPVSLLKLFYNLNLVLLKE